MKNRFLLSASALLNVLLFVCIILFATRLGGFRYLVYRLRSPQAGLYEHRAELYKLLPAQPHAVIFLGDSHIHNCEWSELLDLPDSVNVINRGISGDNLNNLQMRLPEIIRHRPKKIFLQIGINDLFFRKSPEQLLTAYTALIDTLQQQLPDCTLYVHSLLPVNNTVKRLGLNNVAVTSTNSALQQLAQSRSVYYINLAAPLSDSVGNLDAQYTQDGIHLNGKGYLIWKSIIINYLYT